MYLAIGEDGDAVGDFPQHVEVVRDHEDGESKQVAQFAYQFVNPFGADRVETSGRFVEK